MDTDTAVTVPLLSESNTRDVGRFGHRLALGVQWREALSGLPATGTWLTQLERIGKRALVQPFIAHPQARHALVHRDRVARLLAAGAQDKLLVPPLTPAADPTNFVLLGSAPGQTRRYVPRRLALTPVQAGGVPPATLDNIRSAWLWPGADGESPANATVVRGRVRRPDANGLLQPVAWARFTITRPPLALPPPVFGGEPEVTWAHGDDRGEFLAVLGPAIFSGGAALPASVTLTLWVHLPPVTPAFNPLKPLANLPLDVAGSTHGGRVLEGRDPPAGHVLQSGVRFTLKPGMATVLADALLLFP